jgi:antitoxin component YwqK of YwqJK toxin-antitoxin module
MEPKRTYYDDGSIRHELWYVNDELHRLDGPAAISYSKDGSIAHENWIVEDKHHRLDGPAAISYNKDGSIKYERWWINDIGIDDEKSSWLEENDIIAPFSETDQVAIKLRWG